MKKWEKPTVENLDVKMTQTETIGCTNGNFYVGGYKGGNNNDKSNPSA